MYWDDIDRRKAHKDIAMNSDFDIVDVEPFDGSFFDEVYARKIDLNTSTNVKLEETAKKHFYDFGRVDKSIIKRNRDEGEVSTDDVDQEETDDDNEKETDDDSEEKTDDDNKEETDDDRNIDDAPDLFSQIGVNNAITFMEVRTIADLWDVSRFFMYSSKEEASN